VAPLPQPPADGARVADRRLLGAVFANAKAIAATMGPGALDSGVPVPLAGGNPVVGLFLSEAWGELAPDAFYAEIVDSGAVPGAAAMRLRDRVVLNE